MWLTRRAEYRRHLILLALLMVAALYLMQRGPARDAVVTGDTTPPPALDVTHLGSGGGNLSSLTVAHSD
jgi:hypothetical protein